MATARPTVAVSELLDLSVDKSHLTSVSRCCDDQLNPPRGLLLWFSYQENHKSKPVYSRVPFGDGGRATS